MVEYNAYLANDTKRKEKRDWILICILSGAGVLIIPIWAGVAVGFNGFLDFIILVWIVLGFSGNVWHFLKRHFANSKNDVQAIKESFKGFGIGGAVGATAGSFIRDIVYFGLCILAGPIVPFVRVFLVKRKIRTCDEIIKNDEKSLRLMQDYMAYTQTAALTADSDNADAVIAISENFADNIHALTVKEKGKDAAQQEVRTHFARVAVDSEKLR